jgi:AAA15 family ATPase/GTPase
MLCSFSVTNFKSFKDTVTLDLTASDYQFNNECVSNGYVDKALVYGYNGVGKSNLGLAIMDIILNLTDKEKSPLLTVNYSNAETRNPMAEFRYKFKFNDSMLEYNYGKTSPELIVYEHLIIDGKSVVSYHRATGDPLVIDLPGTEMLNKDIGNIKISMIKYIKSNAVLKASRETDVLALFLDFVDRMLFFKNLDERNYAGYKVGGHKIFDEIIQEEHFEDLKNFFSKAELPSNLTYQKTGNQYNVLFSYKQDENTEFAIDFFDNCSTGMSALSLFYYWLQNILFNDAPPSFVFIDEFDAFYHQHLSEFVIETLKKIDNCQFILTTHDTGVMNNDIMRPDCLFLMYRDKIKSVSSSTDRELRQAHNIEKMYRAGAFDE